MSGRRTDKVKESLRESTKTLRGNSLDNRIGLVQFGSGSNVFSELTNDSSAFDNAIGSLCLDGGTIYALGLMKAKEMLNVRTDKSREATVIFMSDGDAWDTDESLQAVMNQLRADNVETYAVQYLSGTTISSSIMLVAGEEDRAYNADKLDSISTVYRTVIRQVRGTKIYTDMKLDSPVDTDNYTIVSGTSTHGAVSVSPDKATWTTSQYPSGISTEVKLHLKLKDTSLMGDLNNLTQTNLTYTAPDAGTQAVSIDTSGAVPDNMRVVGGTELPLHLRVPIDAGPIARKVYRGGYATKVEFVDYVDTQKMEADLSIADDRSIGAWMDPIHWL